MLPFQIRWQQANYAPVSDRPVKEFKPFNKAFPVQVEIFDKMPAGFSPGRTTTFKYGLGDEISCPYLLLFEELNGKEGNFRYLSYFSRFDTEGIHKISVKRVVLILKLENTDCKGFKFIGARFKYPIAGNWLHQPV